MNKASSVFADGDIDADMLYFNARFQSIAFTLASLFFYELQCLATCQVEYDNTGFATRQHNYFPLPLTDVITLAASSCHQ